jgi:hypothetical protein
VQKFDNVHVSPSDSSNRDEIAKVVKLLGMFLHF